MIYSLKYTDDMPEGVGGYARAWFIRIRPKYKDDKGILAHELYHVRQWWKWGIIGRFLYKFDSHYRCEEEVAAYQEQLKYSPNDFDFFAKRITEMYNLNVSIEYIKLRLRDK